MKFKSLLVIALLFSVLATGCLKKKDDNRIVLPENFPETGTVLDITEKNGESATLVPGDVIYLKLVGEANSLKQWTVYSPTSTSALVLKDHKLVGLQDEEAEEFTDEWWLKVVEAGNFNLTFNYGVPGKDVEDVFTFEVTVE